MNFLGTRSRDDPLALLLVDSPGEHVLQQGRRSPRSAMHPPSDEAGHPRPSISGRDGRSCRITSAKSSTNPSDPEAILYPTAAWRDGEIMEAIK